MAACDPPDNYCLLCNIVSDEDEKTHSQNTHKFTKAPVDCFNNLEDICLMLRDLDVQDELIICPFCDETDEDLDNHIKTVHKISEWDCLTCGNKITYQMAKEGLQCCDAQLPGAEECFNPSDSLESLPISSASDSPEHNVPQQIPPPNFPAEQVIPEDELLQDPPLHILPPIQVFEEPVEHEDDLDDDADLIVVLNVVQAPLQEAPDGG